MIPRRLLGIATVILAIDLALILAARGTVVPEQENLASASNHSVVFRERASVGPLKREAALLRKGRQELSPVYLEWREPGEARQEEFLIVEYPPLRTRRRLNRCQELCLTAIPGIGPKTAAAIVAVRRRLGEFHSLSELLAVRGIGPKTYRKIRDYLTLEGTESVGTHAPES